MHTAPFFLSVMYDYLSHMSYMLLRFGVLIFLLLLQYSDVPCNLEYKNTRLLVHWPGHKTQHAGHQVSVRLEYRYAFT